MGDLYNRLTAYGKSDAYPFHMPGHKRNGERFCFENPFSFDITEIDGFDNLHHPEGILKEAMERAASVYGSEKSYFLVNGSSGGILAAVSACVKKGGRLLLARNCHKSVYHGMFLRDLFPVYICPDPICGWGMSGAVSCRQVEKALESHGDIGAVLITSPTYEGICSDVENIAEVCHRRGIPLVVDAAHGAHLAFRKTGSKFPAAALEQGADLVIESLHKTLPSLTQTAILHKKSSLIREDLLEWYLQIYQSSSPSYVLMASMDSCISYMSGPDGKRTMEEYEKRLDRLRKSIGKMEKIRMLETGSYDLSKLVVRIPGLGGRELYDILRLHYGLQPEMCTETYVILMTSPADTEEGFFRLEKALEEINQKNGQRDEVPGRPVILPEPQVVLSPSCTEDMHMEMCPLAECGNRISGEFAYIYPPGIPVLVPGEKVTREILEILFRYREEGFEIMGASGIGKGILRVVEE